MGKQNTVNYVELKNSEFTNGITSLLLPDTKYQTSVVTKGTKKSP